MINSSSGSGSVGTLKREKSSTTSLSDLISAEKSVSKTTSTASLSAFLDANENDQVNPSSSNLENIKFEDIFTDVQSPDYSIWESLFSDQVDFSSDFMVYSPKRTPDVKMSSPKKTLLGNPNSSYNHNHLMGGGSSQVGAFNMMQKGKAQSPLHRVFNSPKNRFMQPESYSLPGVEGLMDDYQRECLGVYNATKKSSRYGCSPDNFEKTLLDMVDLPGSNSSSNYTHAINEAIDLPIPTATTFGDVLNDRSELPRQNSSSRFSNGSGMTQDSDAYHHRLQSQEGVSYGLMTPRSAVAEHVDFTMQEQDSGLQLVHLLLACAEAVAKEEYMSARRYLDLLNRIVSPLGDSMQRVASFFTDALRARLANALTANPNSSTQRPFTRFVPNSLDTLKIYQILYQTCPYVKFAHFTANQTIFEAVETEERVHVIDLDILQGYQWPAFMQALAGRRGAPPFLRITGVGYPQEAVRETGRGLTELAHSLHLRFAFHPVGERLEDLRPHMLNRRIGEALAVNSVNCLHRVPGSSLGNLLGMIRDQAPNIVFLVEQESSHNGPYFLGRFLEALHYYSAIFDSLDATFPIDSAERAKVEQFIFAPEIRNIVACEGLERVERHERLEKWRKMMEGKGFTGVPLSGHAVSQSKMLLGLYSSDGYRLREDRGALLLGWQDRALMAASAWRC